MGRSCFALSNNRSDYVQGVQVRLSATAAAAVAAAAAGAAAKAASSSSNTITIHGAYVGHTQVIHGRKSSCTITIHASYVGHTQVIHGRKSSCTITIHASYVGHTQVSPTSFVSIEVRWSTDGSHRQFFRDQLSRGLFPSQDS